MATSKGTSLSNVRLVYDAADQPGGEFPQGVTLKPGGSKNIGLGKTVTLPFTIWANNTAAATQTLKLRVVSGADGTTEHGMVRINAGFYHPSPVLNFSPTDVVTGIAWDETEVESVTLKNSGLGNLNDVRLSLHNLNGSPAPAWIYLTSAKSQGVIPAGARRKVNIAFSPTQDQVDEGVYSYYLMVAGANYAANKIYLSVAVTQSGEGNALFKISDIYTGTNNSANQRIEGLKGAKIKMQNEDVATVKPTKTTDSKGEALFNGLPAGRYTYRITAKNHTEQTGRLWIKPGVTISEDVFLDYNVVTVEWSVNETTIEDKYEITLNTTFETNVPVAVVVVKPASVTLPAMQAGDVFNGEFTLTNHGLIPAEDISLRLPKSDRNFKYEILGGVPDSIPAKEKITVPYRITCLTSLVPAGDGSGGGCRSYQACVTVSYGSTSSPAPAPSTIRGVKCFAKPERKEGFCTPCYIKGVVSNIFQNVLSSVNMVMREYHREDVDLSVKVPGGSITAKRWYFGGRWRWEDSRHNLRFNYDSLDGKIASIDKGEVVYEAAAGQSGLFTHEFYRIRKTDTGWRWEHKNGEYQLYDDAGRTTEYGNRTGTVGKLIYEPGDTGKLLGIVDRNGIQVLWYDYDVEGRLSAVRDAADRRVEYGYTNGRLTSVVDVLKNTTRFEYDGQGRIKKVIDPENYAATVTYDTYGHVSSVLDDQGNGHRFEYDYSEGANESYVRVSATSGPVRELWYDRYGDPIRVNINGRTMQKIAKDGRHRIITDEHGRITRKEYDEWDNLTKIVYPDGTSVAYEYEHVYNRRIREIDENRIETTFAYDAAGNLTRKVEAAGTDDERVTVFTYDDANNLHTVKRLGDTGTAEALTVMTYDDLGNLTSITDAEQGVTRFTAHDAMGNVLTKQDPRGKLWQYDYDAGGRLGAVTDPMLQVTRFFYDKKGNKNREVDPENRETKYDYDQRGNLVKMTDHLGNETLFVYDPNGRLLKQTDPEGKVVRYEYDADGRLVKTIDGNKNEISMEYDDAIGGAGCASCSGAAGSQPARVVYPTFVKEFVYDDRGRKSVETDVLSATDSYLTGFEYDPAGNLIARTDKEEKTTDYAYDALNRLKTVTDSLNQNTEYFYDNRDNLTALTDAEGNTTWFEYDRNNRLVKEIRPEGRGTPDQQETVYEYDPAGNLIAKTDAKNQRTEYEYDDTGRLVQIRYFAAADHVNPAKTVDFSYDSAGNLTGYDDGTTSAVYTYDDLHRKTSETLIHEQYDWTNTYTYYKNGLKKSFTGPDGVTTYSYTYDDNNQLTSVNIPGAGYITYSSYQWNRPTEVILPGGSKREYFYDPLMRVKTIAAKDPAQNVLLNYQYNYDKVDNITAKVTEHGVYGYGYDDLYRLTAADNPVQNDEGFTYDAVGNRLTAEGVADDWSYNDNNELQGYDGVSFQYDANGNTIQKNDNGVVTKYIYNVEDRLREVRDGSGSLISSYYYDPFGRRLWKEVNGVRTYFVYADEGLVAEADAAGNIVKSYGYKPDSTWTTDPLFMKVGGQYYFYQNDHLGTPRKLTAVNGAIVWLAKYSSFGEAIVEIETVNSNLRFPGQYYDGESGLFYNSFRYYDASTGRYVSSDPIGFGGEDVNLYAYVSNAPIRRFDPYGLYSFDDFLDDAANFSAGFGDTISFGLTKKIRQAMGTDYVVNKCSGLYKGGEIAGFVHGLFMGGAHAGRNIVAQMGKRGKFLTRLGRGTKRFFYDNRRWGTVRNMWSKLMGGLKNKGQHLHHLAIPQRSRIAQGIKNAGFNYIPLSARFNSWMNGSTTTRLAVEWGLKVLVGITELSPLNFVINQSSACECPE